MKQELDENEPLLVDKVNKKKVLVAKLNGANHYITSFFKYPVGYAANTYTDIDPITRLVKNQKNRRYFLIAYGGFFLAPIVARLIPKSVENKKWVMEKVKEVYNVLSITSVTTFSLSRLFLEDVTSEDAAIGAYIGIIIGVTAFAIINKILDHHMQKGRRFPKIVEFEVVLSRMISLASYFLPLINIFVGHLQWWPEKALEITAGVGFFLAGLYEWPRYIAWHKRENKEEISNLEKSFELGTKEVIFDIAVYTFFFSLLTSLYVIIDVTHDNVPPQYITAMAAIAGIACGLNVGWDILIAAVNILFPQHEAEEVNERIQVIEDDPISKEMTTTMGAD